MSSKKKKKEAGRLADSDSLIEIKNALRGAQSPLHAFNQLRQKLETREYPKLAAWLAGNAFLARRIFHPPFPRTMKQLKGHPTLEPVSIEREVKWASAYLAQYSTLLTKFVQISHQFQRAILRADYQTAAHALDTIEQTHGQSLWLIKNRIALLQLAHGLESQKNYAKSVRTNSIPSGLAAAVAHYASQRNEETVTPNRLLEHIKKQFTLYPTEPDVEFYIRHHILPEFPRPKDQLVHLLRHEQASTVVDGYETLITVARLELAGESKKTPSTVAFRDALDALAFVINDPRLGTLLIELGGQRTALPPLDNSAVAARANFLNGAYAVSSQIARSALENTPENPELLLVAAQSEAAISSTQPPRTVSTESAKNETTDEPLWCRIVKGLTTVISRNGKVNEASKDLIKLALNFDGHPWAEAIGGFVIQERSPDPLARMGAISHYTMIGASASTPLLAGVSPSAESRKNFANIIHKQHGDSIISTYALALAADHIAPSTLAAFAPEQQALLLSEHYALAGQFSESLRMATRIGESSSANGMFFRYRIRLECHCLLSLGRVDECVDLMGNVFAQNPTLTDVLPLRAVVAAIDDGVRKKMQARPTLGIVYAVYNSVVDASQEKYLAFAYEDFLVAHNVRRPSELASRLSDFDHQQIVFFFNNVCTESVMEKSIEFRSSREVTEERIAVCRLLREIRPDLAENIQAEIRDLLGKLMVRRRLRDVEQRKIYVDLEGVSRTADTHLRESFNRYVAFIRHGIGTSKTNSSTNPQDTARERLRLLADLQEVTGQGVTLFFVPENEASYVFRSMLSDLRDEYVSSSAHGLDGYLSVRIRHGTLSGQLRSPIEAQHLITPREEATGEYRPNHYWANQFSKSTPETLEQIANYLTSFSRAFDDLVQKMLSDWIRVRRTFEEKGLFDFRLNEYEIQSITEKVGTETSFAEFLQTAFAVFGQRLEKNLAVVRDTLEREAKSKVNDSLTELQTKMASLHNEFDAHAFNTFNNAISAARTDAQVAFDRVIEWFRVSAATAQDPFSIEDAVQVSAESVRTATRKVSVNINSTAPEKQRLLKGALLPNFADLFFIIFENITKHSALPSPYQAEVKITYSDEKIHCRVESAIAHNALNIEAKTRVDEIRLAIRESGNLAAVSREGGTGFHKIRKILAHDLQLPPELDFGLQGEQKFFVEFTIPMQMLAHEAK